MVAAIECQALTRSFRTRSRQGPREVLALAGLDLSVGPGTLFGVLGPNGAGKTTLVRILTTLLLPTSGHARVAGFDVVDHPNRVRASVGFTFGGDRGLYGRLTGRENLLYAGALHGVHGRDARRRAAELLDVVGLRESASRRVETYSRGMRQRLHLARALMHRPPLLLLDEPTTGLDPKAAREVRQLVKRIQSTGATILLTTHLMPEAEELCDALAVLARGRLLAAGRPSELKQRSSQPTVIEVEVETSPVGRDAVAAIRALDHVVAVEVLDEGQRQRVRVHSSGGSGPLLDVLRRLELHGLRTVNVREPTLEDAYLALVHG